MTDKQAAKQRRQAQNRAARQALAARRAAATRSADEGADGRRGGEPEKRRRRGSRSATAGRRGASRVGAASHSSPTRPRAVSPRSEPSPSESYRPEPRSGLGRLHQSVTAEPGGRAVLIGFLLATALSIGLPFIPLIQRPILPYVARQVIEATGSSGPTPEERFESLTVASTASPLVVVFLLVPVAVAASALFASRRPNRVRTLTVAAISQVLFVFLAGIFGLFYVFSAGALGFGAWQARKAATGRTSAAEQDDDDEGEAEPDGEDEPDADEDEDERDDDDEHDQEDEAAVQPDDEDDLHDRGDQDDEAEVDPDEDDLHDQDDPHGQADDDLRDDAGDEAVELDAEEVDQDLGGRRGRRRRRAALGEARERSGRSEPSS